MDSNDDGGLLSPKGIARRLFGRRKHESEGGEKEEQNSPLEDSKTTATNGIESGEKNPQPRKTLILEKPERSTAATSQNTGRKGQNKQTGQETPNDDLPPLPKKATRQPKKPSQRNLTQTPQNNHAQNEQVASQFSNYEKDGEQLGITQQPPDEYAIQGQRNAERLPYHDYGLQQQFDDLQPSSNGGNIEQSYTQTNSVPYHEKNYQQQDNKQLQQVAHDRRNQQQGNALNESHVLTEPKTLPPPETIEFNNIKKLTIEELADMATKYAITNVADLNKQDLVYTILRHFSNINPANIIIGEGVLEIIQDGYGFLRSPSNNYVANPDDIYVSPNQVKKFGLRTGDSIKGEIKAPKKGEKYFALIRLISVNCLDTAHLRSRVRFDDLTPLYPNQKLDLEDATATDDSSRIIDMFSPMGKGQRALIVAAPKTGKTMLLQSIAHAITRAHPDAYLIVLLIDERPEEVTDMSRSVRGEVVSSTFDEPAHRHVQLAEIIIEKAKRLVEYKKDVIILLDSITRLARAYNNVIPSSGKVLTGGVDANALQKPKRFFGAARNIEEGGSLTIIATALIETGSKMDDVIFEEFKGTGNSEILLDRKISDKRIFPAIDITKSSTRKDDLLLSKAVLAKTWMLRKILTNMNPVEAIEFLKDKLKHAKTNEDFYKTMNS